MTLRTRVKICGLTSREDALLAVNAGADAIGLVFYEPSPRHVEIDQACKIAQSIPAFVTKTALFVNPEKAYVQQVLDTVAIDLLQFHGDETAEFCQQFGRPYIKAVRMQESTDLELLAKEFVSSCGLLLDAYVAGKPGGTGEKFNWEWIPKESDLPIILAGGLTSLNVKQAIQVASPWAVDVSGGVEASKGIKSSEKIKQFMQQVMSTVE
ncbi:phosphoribosylanthranilate isomerase [Thiomicrorhabdus sp.]|uniref:phosphoribosylanthranilate isomerase n=1 Tax=Thiomicrorhabdus sp. TaxID=2039724 RepID=UPI002AA753BB|nr:phosphoribosylanthranilate isomerase [Thiomicrorhabdus sp.]